MKRHDLRRFSRKSCFADLCPSKNKSRSIGSLVKPIKNTMTLLIYFSLSRGKGQRNTKTKPFDGTIVIFITNQSSKWPVPSKLHVNLPVAKRPVNSSPPRLLVNPHLPLAVSRNLTVIDLVLSLFVRSVVTKNPRNS